MTTINPTSRDALLASLSQTASKKPGATDAQNQQDRFLTLLVAQMRNQDPMNPLDNAQVTTQLAQISTVTGIDKLNTTVQNLSSALTAVQSLQAGSLIGRGVLGPGQSLLLQQGSATAGVSLANAADQVTVKVTNAAGALVRTLNLGPMPAGTSTFRWDGSTDAGGTAPDGAYKFEVAAVAQGKAATADPIGYGRVQSVTLGSSDLLLNTVGLGQVGLSTVKQILQ